MRKIALKNIVLFLLPLQKNRWAKQGVLDRVFMALQQESSVINIKVDHVSLDSTAVKIHPDGTGALKKRRAIYRQITIRLDNQDAFGRSRRSNSGNIFVSSGSGR